jgi:hypothetical protein
MKGQVSAKRRTNKEHIGKLARDRDKEIPVSTCQAATVHRGVGQASGLIKRVKRAAAPAGPALFAVVWGGRG